ncbi:lipoprotein insertase outer membrane protein LolB [Shewanella sp. AS16]|uniref:lipoprotein insertase outer membrane protein LolB n=1 Tax=Shewanella sp. AS16 TaxID=2907625 RepID=UPI001F37210F|nr:lipoprotein insertase outer membrane protein LolB [Shewanella sp. AS16]MCE9686295.1 lipoprotein insertase outer membrane protein LolB [Shewanella sp. AS16]
MTNLHCITRIALSLSLLWLLALGGCSTLPQSRLAPVNVSQAEQADAWELQGKLAVKSPSDKFSTNLYWLHTQEGDELRLTTMLGTTVLTLCSDRRGARLEVDGKVFEDSQPQRLLERVSGWTIPLASLPLWITGQTGMSPAQVTLDGQGYPSLLLSPDPGAPWRVQFLSWQQQSGATIPKQLRLDREGLQLKIQVNRWQALGQPVAKLPQ